jgi:hypothetical protein
MQQRELGNDLDHVAAAHCVSLGSDACLIDCPLVSGDTDPAQAQLWGASVMTT